MADGKLDAFNVEALEKSVNDSATRVSAIWISFLLFAVYLLTSAGTLDHRQIFLADPLKLPVLNIELSLFGFFLLAPILFVTYHVYVLAQVLLLSRTAATYDAAVERQIAAQDPNASAPQRQEASASFRQRLANTLFAQMFAGSPRESAGWIGTFLHVMALTTLAAVPVALVLFMQFAFLPYHSHLVTWIYRLLAVVELLIVFTVWPLILDSRRDFRWTVMLRRLRQTFTVPLWVWTRRSRWTPTWLALRLRRQLLPHTVCALYIVVALGLGSFPGEPHVNLFTGQVREPLSVHCDRWFFAFDRLSLAGVQVLDIEKVQKLVKDTQERHLDPRLGPRSRDLTRRNFDCANLSQTDTRRADFSKSSMVGANLQNSDLQGTRFDGTDLRAASLFEAWLQGASFREADLRGARLDAAVLEGAHLVGTNLIGASFTEKANLTRTNLSSASLQGSIMDMVDLSGALLVETRLQGSSLKGATLTAARLYQARLQGANLESAVLTRAELIEPYVWRARKADCRQASVSKPADAPVVERGEIATPEAVKGYAERIAAMVPEFTHDALFKRDALRARMLSALAPGRDPESQAAWDRCASESAARAGVPAR